jgi:transcriptional regulator with XRE-family HTH domain
MPKNEVAELNEMYKRIEDLCKEKGVNMTAMCREAGIPRSNLSDLKFGRTAALATVNLNRVATYFDVSLDYLLGNEDTKKPADQMAGGLRDAGYYELTPENQKMIDDLIDALLKRQSGE